MALNKTLRRSFTFEVVLEEKAQLAGDGSFYKIVLQERYLIIKKYSFYFTLLSQSVFKLLAFKK